jgi:subtilisin
MKRKPYLAVLVSFLVASAVLGAMAIPANEKAKENAEAPEKSPVIDLIDETWDLDVDRVGVLIGFTKVPSPSEQALVRGHGGVLKYSYTLIPTIAASIPEAAITGLLHNPHVTRIELDRKVYAIDAELDDAWGVKRIGAGLVHDVGNRGTGVRIAIIDTGIDYTHPDLDANYKGGYDFFNNDSDPKDDHGHGTHVAGSVAAEDNGIGVVGVAPEAELYALKILGANGTGYSSDMIAAMQWAVDHDIEVANLSLGSSANLGVQVEAAFDNAEAAGIVTVAAAGNSGNPNGKGNNVEWPARYNSVIAVAAIGKNDNRARFSSTGDQVEVAAPGVDIRSTYPDNQYATGSGTSMASPHVTGTAGLIMAAGISDTSGNGQVNDEVRQVMNDTAVDLGPVGWDTLYGSGLVDAYAAVQAVTPPSTGSIGGTVANASDQTAIAGAMVTVDTGQSSTTAADGTYTITQVPTGSRNVTASADGFESQTKTVAVDENITTAVDFALNPIPVGTITGEVTNRKDGTPISGATVTVDTGQSSTAAMDGTYTITSVPTGARSVTASADGFHSQTKPANVTESGTTTVDFALTQVSTPTVVLVTLPSGTDGYATEGGRHGDRHLSVTVALEDDLGGPVAGASLSIVLMNLSTYQMWTGTGTTGSDGEVTFRLKNAPAGWYMTGVTSLLADGLYWNGETPDNLFSLRI